MSSFASLKHKISRIAGIYQDAGLVGVKTRLLHRVRLAFRRDEPGHASWLKNKSRVDSEFDDANRTQTGGIGDIFGLQIRGNNSRHGFSHIASDPCEFADAINSLGIRLDDVT